MIQFSSIYSQNQTLSGELIQSLRDTIESGNYILGSQLEDFESKFAEYCAVAHCAGVGNGLDALKLILEALNIGPGDEVIVPGFTFIATWLAVSQVGATPIPHDVSLSDANLCPDDLDKRVTHRTKAVIAVHLYGHPAKMREISAFCERNGLLLIEDAAQAHGAKYGGKPVGSIGDAAAFSFYPTKVLGALGDGGCVTSKDAAIIKRIKSLRNYGSIHKYHHDEVGVNSRLDELQAGFLSVKLKHLDEWRHKKQNIANLYFERLQNIAEVSPFECDDTIEHAWHIFAIKAENRDNLAAHLNANNVQCGIHYPLTPAQCDAYKELRDYPLPNSSALASTVLSLPMHEYLSEEDVDLTTKLIKDFYT